MVHESTLLFKSIKNDIIFQKGKKFSREKASFSERKLKVSFKAFKRV